MATILIVGISGFAGRHLCAHLKEIGGDALFGTFNRPIRSKDRLFYGSEVGLLRCDIRRYSDITATLTSVQPDQVYFLSALVTVARADRVARSIYQTNVMGAANFYEAVRKICPNVKILAVGSAEEYGKVVPAMLPISESAPLLPVNSYGLSKAMAEEIGLYYHRVFGLDTRFTRTFHYSGPLQPPLFVVSDFGRQIVEIEKGMSRKIRVGNLEARRDFTDIRDVVSAYVSLIQSGIPGEVYNVCSGEAVAIRTILERMAAFSKSKIVIETDQRRFRPLDVPEFRGNNDLLTKTTGWTRRYTIDQTIQDVLEHWRNSIPPIPR